jgi:peptide subunit release factor 1 (eRF1)
MSSATQTTVIFACPKCGTAYQATREQHPGSFKCQDCQTEVHAWSGVFSFFDWKAYEAVGSTLESWHNQTPTKMNPWATRER